MLHWTSDGWQHATDTRSTPTAVDIEFVDLGPIEQNAPIRLTFFWLKDNRWEEQDYTIEVRACTTAQARKETYGEIADRVA